MKTENKTANTPHFEELEERLEMAQVAASDLIRCNGSVSTSLEEATDVEAQP